MQWKPVWLGNTLQKKQYYHYMVMSYKPWIQGCTEKETNCNQIYEFKYTIQIAVNLWHCQ